MSKYLRFGAVISFIFLFVSGCATVSTYTLDREREDQEMTGNAGYLSGTPQSPDRSQSRKTRRTYVLEVLTKGPEEQEVQIPEVNTQIAPDLNSRPVRRESSQVQPVRIPAIESTSVESAALPAGRQAVESAGTGFTEYTVLEDDTLQKISKKFYDRYSRWQKIYDANQDVITDPNNIKPGIILKIPNE